MKQLKLHTKFLILGAILIAVFNPLSVALWVDVLIIVIEQLSMYLVQASNYTMAVGGTLLVVGGILWNTERNKREDARLTKLGKKKTKSQKYLVTD